MTGGRGFSEDEDFTTETEGVTVMRPAAAVSISAVGFAPAFVTTSARPNRFVVRLPPRLAAPVPEPKPTPEPPRQIAPEPPSVPIVPPELADAIKTLAAQVPEIMRTLRQINGRLDSLEEAVREREDDAALIHLLSSQ